MGRPTKLTKETAERIISARATGATWEEAALAAGVNKATVYRWKARGREAKRGMYRDFYDRAERADEEAVQEVARMFMARMRDPNTQWQALAWWMERRRPERYAKRDVSELHMKTETAVPVEFVTADGKTANVAEVLAAVEHSGDGGDGDG